MMMEDNEDEMSILLSNSPNFHVGATFDNAMSVDDDDQEEHSAAPGLSVVTQARKGLPAPNGAAPSSFAAKAASKVPTPAAAAAAAAASAAKPKGDTETRRARKELIDREYKANPNPSPETIAKISKEMGITESEVRKRFNKRKDAAERKATKKGSKAPAISSSSSSASASAKKTAPIDLNDDESQSSGSEDSSDSSDDSSSSDGSGSSSSGSSSEDESQPKSKAKKPVPSQLTIPAPNASSSAATKSPKASTPTPASSAGKKAVPSVPAASASTGIGSVAARKMWLEKMAPFTDSRGRIASVEIIPSLLEFIKAASTPAERYSSLECIIKDMDTHILSQFSEKGGLVMMADWISDARAQGEAHLLKHYFQKLDLFIVTIESLRKSNIVDLLKRFKGKADEASKLALDLVAKWKNTFSNASSPSAPGVSSLSPSAPAAASSPSSASTPTGMKRKLETEPETPINGAAKVAKGEESKGSSLKPDYLTTGRRKTVQAVDAEDLAAAPSAAASSSAPVAVKKAKMPPPAVNMAPRQILSSDDIHKQKREEKIRAEIGIAAPPPPPVAVAVASSSSSSSLAPIPISVPSAKSEVMDIDSSPAMSRSGSISGVPSSAAASSSSAAPSKLKSILSKSKKLSSRRLTWAPDDQLQKIEYIDPRENSPLSTAATPLGAAASIAGTEGHGSHDFKSELKLEKFVREREKKEQQSKLDKMEATIPWRHPEPLDFVNGEDEPTWGHGEASTEAQVERSRQSSILSVIYPTRAMIPPHPAEAPVEPDYDEHSVRVYIEPLQQLMQPQLQQQQQQQQQYHPSGPVSMPSLFAQAAPQQLQQQSYYNPQAAASSSAAAAAVASPHYGGFAGAPMMGAVSAVPQVSSTLQDEAINLLRACGIAITATSQNRMQMLLSSRHSNPQHFQDIVSNGSKLAEYLRIDEAAAQQPQQMQQIQQPQYLNAAPPPYTQPQPPSYYSHQQQQQQQQQQGYAGQTFQLYGQQQAAPQQSYYGAPVTAAASSSAPPSYSASGFGGMAQQQPPAYGSYQQQPQQQPQQQFRSAGYGQAAATARNANAIPVASSPMLGLGGFAGQSSAPPQQQQHQSRYPHPCKFWSSGKCGKGDKCQFYHAPK